MEFNPQGGTILHMNKNALRFLIFSGLFLIPFVPFLVSSSLFFPFITTKAFAFRVIVEVIFAAWVLLVLIDPESRPKKSPVIYALAAFLVVVGIADVLGASPVKSFWSNYERMEGFVGLLHLGALFLVIGSVFKEKDWSRWWNTSLFASGLMVLYSLAQLSGAVTINQGGVRVDGTFGNASYLAVYMLVHAFISVLFLWREGRNTTKRYVYGLLLLGQLFILYHTATRGAILGFLGGLLLAALLNIRNKENAVVRKASVGVLIALAVIVSGFAFGRETSFVRESPVLSRFSTISTEELKSGGRSFVWPMAVKGIMEKPILGWGQENFSSIFQKYYRPEMYHLEPWFDRAHNIFLDWAVSGGLLGLALYLSLYGVALNLIWRSDKNFSHTERSILTALIAAYFFHNFFVFDHLMSYVLFFAILAYLHSRVAAVNFWNKDLSEEKLKLVTAPIVVALVFVIYLVNIKPLTANTSLINALRALQSGQHSVAATELMEGYYGSTLGKREASEQIVANSLNILGSGISMEEKNKFFNFARDVVREQSRESNGDTRVELIAGSFFRATGFPDEALAHLEIARQLSPYKQAVYLEIADTYISKKDMQNAIKTLMALAEFSPDHRDDVENFIKQINK